MNKKSFDLFKKRCDFFIEKFGLVDWEIHIEKEIDLKESQRVENCRAFTSCSIEDKLACIVVSDVWDVELNNYWLSKIAFHECLEILFWSITEKFKSKNRAEIIHDIIRVLENTLFPFYYDSGFKK